ncbi:MAG TPA: hypothetical protein VF765_24370 [Polyangiaceae bacterium]
MNSKHALQVGLRSLILVALTAFAAACGASPDGQSTVDDKSLTEPAGDPDAAAPSASVTPAPSGSVTPAPSASLPTHYGPVPQETPPVGPPQGGYVPPTHSPGGEPYAQ